MGLSRYQLVTRLIVGTLMVALGIAVYLTWSDGFSLQVEAIRQACVDAHPPHSCQFPVSTPVPFLAGAILATVGGFLVFRGLIGLAGATTEKPVR